MINQEILFLSIITLSFMCLLFLLLLYLIIRKAKEIKKRREIESYKNRINTQIFSIIAEGKRYRGIGCETAIKQKAMEELLSRYVKILEGEEEKKRLWDLASHCLQGYYRKRLKSKKWSHRMNALYHIEDFHMIKLLDEVVILSKKKNITHQENIHVLRILATFQYKGLNEVLHYHDLSEYEYRSIFMRLNHDLFDQFVLSFHKSTPPAKICHSGCYLIEKSNRIPFFYREYFYNL
jgi:hypothetical protein